MKLIDAKTVAAELGIRVETVYRMAQEGRIPVALRIGPKIRFDRDEIERLVGSGERL
jgi:excisionase family DNA binding protein